MPDPDPAQSGLLNTCPECGLVVDVSSHGAFEKIECPGCGSAMRVRTQFDQFVIQRRLGEGGMSQVFLAKDTTLGREVALKILHPQFTEQAELTNRFEKEAELTALISHPNVVKVYSVGRDQGNFYIAMEYVDGLSLEELVREGRMEEGRALEIGVQVAQGLRAAHQRGLIHRDIKPGNILITRSGVAKIVDFGLALAAERDRDESSVIWATPYYVPPEKLNEEGEDARSDMYSLGATLFHALAGHPPFDVDTTSLSELRELKEKPVSLKDAAPEVSPGTCDVIDTMLRRRPAERFADYDRLLAALQAARTIQGQAGSREAAKDGAYSQRAIAVAAVFFFLVAGLILYEAMLDREDAGRSDEEAAPVQSVVVAEEGSTGSTVAARFLEGRELLLKGEPAQAAAIFSQLVDDHRVAQPTLNWAIYNAGLCALLGGDHEGARAHFRRLGEENWVPEDPEEEDLAEFFAAVSRHMQRELPVMESELDPAGATDVRAMAWLAYGLKNWQDGRFDEAFTFFEAFRDSVPPKRLEWINSYKGLLGDFESDRATLARIPKPAKAMSMEEAKAALAEFEELDDTLRVKGSAVDLFKDRWARTQVVHDRLVQEERRRELERLAAEKLEQEQRREREFMAFKELVNSLKPFENPAGFAKAVEKLAAADFEDAEVRKALADERRIWAAAAGFTATLVEDLNRYGYSGEIGRVEAAPLRGTIGQATAEEIRVRMAIGGTIGETTLPFRSLSNEGLLTIGREVLKSISDAAESRDRHEKLIFYAAKTGRRDFADIVGSKFASEDPVFAAFWERLPKAATEGEDNHS